MLAPQMLSSIIWHRVVPASNCTGCAAMTMLTM